MLGFQVLHLKIGLLFVVFLVRIVVLEEERENSFSMKIHNYCKETAFILAVKLHYMVTHHS